MRKRSITFQECERVRCYLSRTHTELEHATTVKNKDDDDFEANFGKPTPENIRRDAVLDDMLLGSEEDVDSSPFEQIAVPINDNKDGNCDLADCRAVFSKFFKI